MTYHQDRFAIEVEDWKGRTVRMTWATYDAHKDKHVEVSEYVEEAKLLIGDPDMVCVDDNSGGVYLYRMGLGKGKYSRAYLLAVIYYRPSTVGSLATYFFTSRVRPDLRIEEYRLIVSESGQRIALSIGGQL